MDNCYVRVIVPQQIWMEKFWIFYISISKIAAYLVHMQQLKLVHKPVNCPIK